MDYPRSFLPNSTVKTAITSKACAIAEKIAALPREVIAVFAVVGRIPENDNRFSIVLLLKSRCCLIRDDESFERRLLLLPLLLRYVFSLRSSSKPCPRQIHILSCALPLQGSTDLSENVDILDGILDHLLKNA